MTMRAFWLLLAIAVSAAANEVEVIDLGDGVKMEFVLIRPGTFVMGSDANRLDERPARPVTLTQPYCLGKYEVTQAQWARVMGSNPSHFKGPQRPVENVSWDDCQLFLAALRKRTGRRFALPAEAEWEYACRAGTTTEYGWGNDEAALGDHAWYANNAGLATHPVGQKRPNPWGLHDMHGNVYEWCADWYSEGPYSSGEATDPRGPRAGQRRILRGGAWIFVSANLRSADRGFSPPDYRSNEYGLRCVLRVDADRPSAEERVQPAAAVAWPGSTEPLTVELGGGATMEFVLIRPGTFIMGSDLSPLENERPTHPVRIARPFYLGKYEVTQRQWDALMSRNPSAFRGDPPLADPARLPVENVSWTLCQSFLEQLNARVPGRKFRLPTEAEWEYAARAGSTGERHFGDGALDDHAWHGGNAGGRTHPFGGKQPNAWGLHDMYGNVWEWCEDRYGPYAATAVEDPIGPGVASFTGTRVLRGGAWNNSAKHVSSTFRHDAGPAIPMRYYGFRCVAEIPEPKTTGPR